MLRNISKLKELKAAVYAAFVSLAFLKTGAKPAFAQIIRATEANTLCDLEVVLANIIRVSVSLAGIGLFIMLVIGGIRYLTSSGDPKATQQARGTITYAIIGMALLLIAWFVLRFIEIFTGVTVTEFSVCLS